MAHTMGREARTSQQGRSAFCRILEASRKVGWRIDDVLGDNDHLDLTRPLLPESLTRAQHITSLSPREKRALNHIRGGTYLRLFGLVERFILPFVVDHTRTRLGQDPFESRALLVFAEEEQKHIQLFERFSQRFQEDFGAPCTFIGPPEAIADEVLRHSPLGVS